MLRRDLLRTGVAAGALGIGGCFGGSQGAVFRDGFEDGLGDWTADAVISPEVDVDDIGGKVVAFDDADHWVTENRSAAYRDELERFLSE